MEILINDKKYELIKNEKEGFDKALALEKITDYFDDFDYIIGDWAYGKLRLKGFCDSNNKIFKSYNDYKKIDNYIKERCAVGCKYFILKKIEK